MGKPSIYPSSHTFLLRTIAYHSENAHFIFGAVPHMGFVVQREGVNVIIGCRNFFPFVCRNWPFPQLESSITDDRYLSKNYDTELSDLQHGGMAKGTKRYLL